MATRTTLPIAILILELSILTAAFNVSYDPSRIGELTVDGEINVTLSLTSDSFLSVDNEDIAVDAKPSFNLGASFFEEPWRCVDYVCNRTFKVIGRFLGFGKVFVLRKNDSKNILENGTAWNTLHPPLEVTIVREKTVLNKVFVVFVATVVTINYINFGCALEVDIVKKVLRRPIGPAVGFVCQFVVMPLVCYGVGYLLFTDPILRLGLLTFGCSPGGGASNMWTVLLDGNLNLSITMTFVSSIAAFGTIPLWIFTLGVTIIKDTHIVVPYVNIITSLISLAVPITIGLLIQRYLPKVAARSKRILAPVCIILIIAIIVMAAISNTFIFFLLNWSIVFAAVMSVWTGFVVGLIVSTAFRFPIGDVIAVAVETGIQNTGISFVLLNYSLPHPVSEMATVVPVAASLITPIPLFMLYCSKKIRNCLFRSDKLELMAINKDPYRSTAHMIEDDEAQELKHIR